MRLSALLVTALASLASASAILRRQNSPACEQTCNQEVTAEPNLGCSSTDNGCLCRNPTYTIDMTSCITMTCTNPSDLKLAKEYIQNTCAGIGINVTLSSTITNWAIPTATITHSATPAVITSAKSAGFASEKSVGIAALGVVAAAIAIAL